MPVYVDIERRETETSNSERPWFWLAKKIKSNQVAYSPTVYLNASNPFYLRDKPGNK